jgi:thiol:disulfide interchange protein DsbA
MIRRLLAPVFLVALLGACSREDAAPATPAADATAAAAAPADAAPAGPVVAAALPATPAAPAGPNTNPVLPPSGPEPRLGADYEVLETPQPTYGQGRIEVAEIFSYACIHCAEFQPKVNAWKAVQPADVRFEYVPAAFGGNWDEFARAYYAAEVMGLHERTHDAVFNAVFVEKKITDAKPESLADLYAGWGADKAQFLATMKSFGVTAKLNRGKQFAMRTGVNSTPTIIVNGKYRVNVTQDRGFDGMLSAVDHLVARERAAMAAPAPVAPAADPAAAPATVPPAG